MPNALGVRYLEILHQNEVESLERRLRRWGWWFREIATNAMLEYQKRNMLARMMGKPYDSSTEWADEFETNAAVHATTLIDPIWGAAVTAHYGSLRGDERVARFNRYLIDGGHRGRSKATYYRALSNGRDSVKGFLRLRSECEANLILTE